MRKPLNLQAHELMVRAGVLNRKIADACTEASFGLWPETDATRDLEREAAAILAESERLELLRARWLAEGMLWRIALLLELANAASDYERARIVSNAHESPQDDSDVSGAR